MNGRRLDDIARLLARGASRRQLLAAIVTTAIGTASRSDPPSGVQLCRDHGEPCSPVGTSEQCCTGYCRRSSTQDHVCDCPPGSTYCRDPTGFEFCTNTKIDEQNCGACGHACPQPPGATTTCLRGTCRFETSVFVPANQPNGIDTGINLSTGGSLCITAEGVGYFCSANSASCLSGPDGSKVVAYATCVNTAFPCGTLLGRVGRDGHPFRVGAEHCFSAGGPGSLHLFVNDARFSGAATDNRGGYTATITG